MDDPLSAALVYVPHYRWVVSQFLQLFFYAKGNKNEANTDYSDLSVCERALISRLFYIYYDSTFHSHIWGVWDGVIHIDTRMYFTTAAE